MCSRLNCFDYNLTAVELKLICRRFNLNVSHLHIEPVILKLNFTESSQTVCQSRLSKHIGTNCIDYKMGCSFGEEFKALLFDLLEAHDMLLEVKFITFQYEMSMKNF
jgi:hypothetical protein